MGTLQDSGRAKLDFLISSSITAGFSCFASIFGLSGLLSASSWIYQATHQFWERGIHRTVRTRAA
jgi:hypothetical protein